VSGPNRSRAARLFRADLLLEHYRRLTGLADWPRDGEAARELFAELLADLRAEAARRKVGWHDVSVRSIKKHFETTKAERDGQAPGILRSADGGV
jgi:hypothetical protein